MSFKQFALLTLVNVIGTIIALAVIDRFFNPSRAFVERLTK